MELLRIFITETLTAAAEEIFGVVEKTISEKEDEVLRIQRLMDVLQPEIKLHRADLQQLTLSGAEFPPDQQHCEQEWSPSLGQEDPEPTLIKEEELSTSQEEEQLQVLETDTKYFISSPACVTSDYEEDPTQPSHLYQDLQDGHGARDPLLWTTTEHMKTEPDGQDYGEPQPARVSQLLCAVNPDCPAAHSENSVRVTSIETEGPLAGIKPVSSKRTKTGKGHISHINTKGRKSTGVSHMKSHSQSHATPNYCKVCGMAFYYMGSFIKHMQTIHTNNKGHICGVCGINLPSTESMKDHLQTHIAARYTCHICSKKFTLKRNLMGHMRIHKEKPYHCPYCVKGFNSSGNLKRHVRIHTGEKPYRCTACGSVFNNNSYLKIHMRIHTGEKPYCCKDCGKTFSRSEPLKVHVRTHTGEKPYKCCDCDKGFRTSCQLKKHLIVHTGEKSYHCGDCGKEFSLKENLKVHQRTHKRERPYHCGDCGKGFITCKQLNVHILTHRRESSSEERNGVINLDDALSKPAMFAGGH